MLTRKAVPRVPSAESETKALAIATGPTMITVLGWRMRIAISHSASTTTIETMPRRSEMLRPRRPIRRPGG